MDYQKVVDAMAGMACVISVEKKGESYGTIRIVTGNKAYIDSIEGANGAPKMLTDKFIPNSEYQMYFTKDLNFEDYCYRSAILKHPLHSYVHPERYDFWFNLFFMPLESDDENMGYCIYTQEIKPVADSAMMSNLSRETATAVLETCIKLHGSDDFRETMRNVVTDIREICKAKYCCIMQMDFSNRTCELLGENMAEEANLDGNDNWMDAEFFTIAETWMDIIGGSNCLILKNKQDMELIKEKNPIWYESMTVAQVDSMVLIPLKSRGQLIGYIWATNFATEDVVRIKETLELTSYFVSSEIANYQLVNRLQTLSSIDLLTGLQNRNALNDRLDKLSMQKDPDVKTVGVIFADMNGLKRVNDSEGHVSGDLLLKNAALLLQSVFVDGEVYRAGGDEFMILIMNPKKDIFDKQVERIREISKGYDNGTFAVGTCLGMEAKDVRKALEKADEEMYEEKERFYAIHPEMRR